MGITGSDISKEAADMILLDDNFSSIVAGVEEGRLIFDNLKKSIAYTLEHLTSEVIPFLLFFLVQIPLPLTVVLILCIDLGTDLFPAISCAYEEAESDIMKRPPRNPVKDNLVGWRLFLFAYLQIGLIQVCGVMFTYFYVFRRLGYTTSMLVGAGEDWDDVNINGNLSMPPTTQFGGTTQAQRSEDLKTVQTAVFLSIVIVQWGGLLVCKTRKLSLFQQGMRNKAINYSLVAETLIAVFLIYVPGVCDVTGTDKKFPVEFWWPPMPFTILVVVYDEVRKFVIRSNPGGWVERITYY
jgi:sodium/potassium-transporting ATPase subunit alpha